MPVVLFWLLAAGVEALFWERFAGWWGLVVAGIAWYIAAADTINEQYKRVSYHPMGRFFFALLLSLACSAAAPCCRAMFVLLQHSREPVARSRRPCCRGP